MAANGVKNAVNGEEGRGRKSRHTAAFLENVPSSNASRCQDITMDGSLRKTGGKKLSLQVKRMGATNTMSSHMIRLSHHHCFISHSQPFFQLLYTHFFTTVDFLNVVTIRDGASA